MTIIIHPENCAGCGACIDVCPQGAITLNESIIAIHDDEKCDECGACVYECPADTIEQKDK
jgi:ferredoxin